MKTKSGQSGISTLEAEVTNISIHGFWLLIADREYYIPFDKFPWFKKASIDAIHNVQLLHATHLYWPLLDIDIDLLSIEHPENFPLIAS